MLRLKKRSVFAFLLACGLMLGAFVLYRSSMGHERVALAYSGNNPVVDGSLDGRGPSLIGAYEKRQARFGLARDPAQILQMSGSDIQRVLYEPELVRADLPTVIWQYRGDGCALDVYFTAAGTDVSNSPVVHYEMRSRDVRAVAKVDGAACIESIKRPRRSLVSFLDFSALYKPVR